MMNPRIATLMADVCFVRKCNENLHCSTRQIANEAPTEASKNAPTFCVEIKVGNNMYHSIHEFLLS